MRVLVFNGDGAESIADAFDGYAVDTCVAPDEIAARVATEKYDIVVIAWSWPDSVGVELCRNVRQSSNGTSIVVVSTRSEPKEIINALDAGADDYVTRPFHSDELMARARAVVRRASRASGRIAAGPIELDLHQRIARSSGRRIDTTAREFALLALMVRSAGQLVTRAEILAQVWFLNRDAGSNVIDVHMRNLREKLGSASVHLQTVRGQGYRFITLS